MELTNHLPHNQENIWHILGHFGNLNLTLTLKSSINIYNRHLALLYKSQKAHVYGASYDN